MKHKSLGIIVLGAMLALSSCGASASGQLEDLRAGIDSGDECPQLFKIFDEIPEDAAEFPDAQGEMRNVGCHTRTSERTDGDLAESAPDSPWLGVPGERVALSEECEAAAEAAAGETDPDAAEALIAETLEACGSANEWMSALQEHPGVMGLVEGYIPKLSDLQLVCSHYPDSATCEDAAAQGLDV